MIEYPRPIDVQMVKIFRQAQNELFSEFITAIETGKDLTYLTSRINSITEELTIKYNTFQNIAIRESYLEGTLFYDIPEQQAIKEFLVKGVDMETGLRLTTGTSLVSSLGSVNSEMVERLLQQGQEYIGQAVANTKRLMISTYGDAMIKKTFENMAVSEIKGKSVFESRMELVKFFEDSGIGSFVDRSGKKRTLERYGEMLVRTETAKSNIIGTLTKGQELGFTKYRRIERADCCPICSPHRSDVIDLKDGMPYILLHPQCRGYWEPIME